MNVDWTPLLEQAYDAATHSPDPSTQNGALLVQTYPFVIELACNDFPAGVQTTSERLERPSKSQFIEHAERRVIYAAARHGVATEGLTMVACWASCADCARAIVDAGVAILVRHKPQPLLEDEASSRWMASIEVGDTIMREGGVRIVDYTAAIPGAPTILRDGKVWQP